MDLVSVWLVVNDIARSTLIEPVTIYGLDLLAASVPLNVIMKSAIVMPGMLADESARTDLDAMQRRQHLGAYTIIGTLICGFFLPIIAVGRYILVSIVFFITPDSHHCMGEIEEERVVFLVLSGSGPSC